MSVLLAVLAFATLASCDKVPLTAPTESTIELAISTTVVPINGTAEIIATVIEKAGTPVHNGTVVTFTATFGTVEPREAQTVGGTARAKFIGTSSGVATISALSGGAVKTLENVIKVGGAAAGIVSVRTVPGMVPQAGGTVTVFATVIDLSGNPLPSVPVIFTSDSGSLSSNTAITDPTGTAQISLSANRATKITARVAEKTGEATVTVAAAPSLTIAIDSNPVHAVGVPVTFTVKTALETVNATPLQFVAIDYGDGSAVQNLGTVVGEVTALHTYQNPGSYIVTATAIDILDQKATASIVAIVQKVLPTITITPSPVSPIAAGTSVAFTVEVAAGTGGPPVRDAVVTLNGTVVFSFSGTGKGSFSRQFNSPGTFTLQGTVTDTAGAVGTTTTSVVVTGLTMTLDAFSSTVNPIICVPGDLPEDVFGR